MDREEFLKQYFQTLIGWVFPDGVRIERVTVRPIVAEDQSEFEPVMYVVAHSSLSRKKIQGSYGKLMTKIAHARDFVGCEVTLSIHPEAEVLTTLAPIDIDMPAVIPSSPRSDDDLSDGDPEPTDAE